MLPRNTARTVSVDGATFRWLVSDAGTGLLLVERDGGARLEVTLVREIDGTYWTPLATSPGPVTPRIVAGLIAIARARGWEPAVPGPPFRLRA